MRRYFDIRFLADASGGGGVGGRRLFEASSAEEARDLVNRIQLLRTVRNVQDKRAEKRNKGTTSSGRTSNRVTRSAQQLAVGGGGGSQASESKPRGLGNALGLADAVAEVRSLDGGLDAYRAHERPRGSGGLQPAERSSHHGGSKPGSHVDGSSHVASRGGNGRGDDSKTAEADAPDAPGHVSAGGDVGEMLTPRSK
jgi:hypothetical protein